MSERAATIYALCDSRVADTVARVRWESVAIIRERYAAGVRQAQLVRDFNVSPGTIHRVVHNNGWVRA
jgi:uncharacterized protein YjcR